jgi:hypothetical protein
MGKAWTAMTARTILLVKIEGILQRDDVFAREGLVRQKLQ